ncbi:MAG: hypothetical protein A2X02_00130 [Bacteroidetes bacterium GWF2_29_10]|nr:MAG: hypothetical protein A2X02_00130 [Bacteroidetes bacterium GWF2_29_10]
MLLFEYKNKFHRIFIHVIFWLAYLFFFAILSAITSKFNFFSILLQGFYSLPIDIVATYFTIYFLLPKYLIKKKYIPFALFSLFVGFITIVLNQILQVYVFLPIYYPQLIGKIKFFSLQFDLFSYLVSSYSVVIFAVGVKFIKFWVEVTKAKAQLENQNLKSELSLLKSQLNPHFLFNVLNNIDTLIHTNPERASKSIIKLSDILRYVTYEISNDYVCISKEVDYLNSYIQLSALRFGEKYISFDCSIKNTERLIAPMLFIPLVENAIKHGNKKTDNSIKISLKVDTNIEFNVTNYIPGINSYKDKVGGIGIQNLKRRLELIYPGAYKYDIINTDDEKYTAKLWIK